MADDTLNIRRLDAAAADFGRQLDALLAWESVSDTSVQAAVTAIVQEAFTPSFFGVMFRVWVPAMFVVATFQSPGR